MAKKTNAGEGSGSSAETKLARDAVSLTEELLDKDSGEEYSGGDPQKEADEANLKLIKTLANEVARTSVQTSKELAETALEEAKNKRAEAKRASVQPVAPVASVVTASPVGPLGLMNNNVAAILLTLPEGERLQYLRDNPHLLSGGLPGSGAFNPFFPQAQVGSQSDKKEADGSTLGGIAQLLNVQGNQGAQSMLMAVELFKTLRDSDSHKPSNGDGAGSGKEFQALASAMEKLANMVVQGQQSTQAQITNFTTSFKAEAQAAQNMIYEKYLQARDEAAAARADVDKERNQVQVSALMEKLQRIEDDRAKALANPVQAQPLLSELRNVIEMARQQGVPVSTETAEQEKERHLYALELEKLKMQDKMMTQNHLEKLADSRKFEAKVGGLIGILSTLKDDNDAMRLKKAVANGGSPVAQSLYKKAST